MRRTNGRVGGKPRAMRDIVKAFRRPPRFAHCRVACATGTAASQGFRVAHGFETGRMASDVPLSPRRSLRRSQGRRATRSWPKALGNRLYGSLSALLGIRLTFGPFFGSELLDSTRFKAIPSLNKALVLELARCEYVDRRENVIALGNSGTGKTHVALGLGLAACQKGLSVGFITAAALVHELMEARDA